jgi:hypothetical protein
MMRFQGDKAYFLGLTNDGMKDRAAFEARVEAIFAPFKDENGNECVSTENGFSCRQEALEDAMAEVAEAIRKRRAGELKVEHSSPERVKSVNIADYFPELADK